VVRLAPVGSLTWSDKLWRSAASFNAQIGTFGCSLTAGGDFNFWPALREADGGRVRRIEISQHDDGKDRQRDAKADHEFSQR